jgi:hypothetical protein
LCVLEQDRRWEYKWHQARSDVRMPQPYTLAFSFLLVILGALRSTERASDFT